MADTVSKKNNDHFTNQAQLHRKVADHTRQMISQHKVLHDHLIEASHSSCMSNALQHYIDWWESLHTSLQKHVDLHEQMAGHLEKSVASFDDTDQNIEHGFSVNNTGFSS